MLVLSRKRNESIVIGNEITLTVVEVRHDKVRIGITAPKEVPVHRQEVFDQIQAEAAARAAQRAAAVPTPIEQAVAAAMPTVEERAEKRAKRIRGEKAGKAAS